MAAITEILSILCDDIRTETGNKVSLMGVYGREIRVAGAEAVIPRLSLYVRLSAAQPIQCSATLDVIGPGGASILGHAPPQLDNVKVSGEVNIGLGVGPLRLSTAGDHKMRLSLQSDSAGAFVFEHRFLLTLNHK